MQALSVDERIQQILADPSATYAAKRWLKEALGRDPVDAVNDLDLVLSVMKDRLAGIMGRS